MESLNIPPGYLTAHQTARTIGITLGALRNLVYRGQLTRSGGTERQPYYAVPEVTALAAEGQERQTA